MVDILEEASEEIRQERINKFLVKYGSVFLVFTVIFFIVTVAYIWWTSHQNDKLHRLASEFAVSSLKLQSENFETGISQLNALSNSNTQFGALSALNLVTFYTSTNDYDKVLPLLDKVINNTAFDELYRNYALLLKIELQINLDKISMSEAIIALEAYNSEATYFKFRAKELIAAMYLSNNDKMSAKKVLDEVSTYTDMSPKYRQIFEEMNLLTA